MSSLRDWNSLNDRPENRDVIGRTGPADQLIKQSDARALYGVVYYFLIIRTIELDSFISRKMEENTLELSFAMDFSEEDEEEDRNDSSDSDNDDGIWEIFGASSLLYPHGVGTLRR